MTLEELSTFLVANPGLTIEFSFDPRVEAIKIEVRQFVGGRWLCLDTYAWCDRPRLSFGQRTLETELPLVLDRFLRVLASSSASSSSQTTGSQGDQLNHEEKESRQ